MERDGFYYSDGAPSTPGGLAGQAEMAADTVSLVEKSKTALGRGMGPGGLAKNAVTPQPDPAVVPVRKNLNETAFFFPHLISSKAGEVKLRFTMPEALTEWKLMAFAHDTKTRSGFIDGKAVTSLDLMVRPNAPRFLREGDALEFTTRVINTGETERV